MDLSKAKDIARRLKSFAELDRKATDEIGWIALAYSCSRVKAGIMIANANELLAARSKSPIERFRELVDAYEVGDRQTVLVPKDLARELLAIGRDPGLGGTNYCSPDRGDGDGCPGFMSEPYPGDLWPGERRGEMGEERRDRWLPIESAPRDGTAILAAKASGVTAAVRWKGSSWVSATWVDCVFLAAEFWQPLLAAPEVLE